MERLGSLGCESGKLFSIYTSSRVYDIQTYEVGDSGPLIGLDAPLPLPLVLPTGVDR